MPVRSVALVLMAFAVSVCARPPDADLQAGTRAVVMIHGQFEGAETFGAGIVFGREKNRLYVVTASHVVRRGAATAQKIEIHLKDVPGMPLKATLLPNFDKDLDIAVLLADSQPAFDSCSLAVDILGAASRLKRSDAVFPVGNPNGVAWGTPVEPDRVAQLTDGMVAFQSAFITAGDSGGALLTDSGSIVAMITADAPPFGRAVGIERVTGRLRQWGYPLQLRQADSPSPLMQAIHAGDSGKVKAALATVCPENGAQPLREAAQHASAEIVQLLLQAGAKDGDGSTPFGLALRNRNIGAASALAHAGANTKVAMDVAYDAASDGQLDVLHFLPEVGVDFKHQDKSGDTPLHYAAEALQAEAAEFLLNAGADPNLLDRDGESPLYKAISRAPILGNPAQTQRASATVEVLLRNRGNPNQLYKGTTMLALAARVPLMPIVQALLAAGADVKQAGADGRTALHFAAGLAKNGDYKAKEQAETQRQLLQMLIAKGPDLNVPDRDGNPPLCSALIINTALPRIEVARMLLDAGAKPISDWFTRCRSVLAIAGWPDQQQIDDLFKSYVK